MTDGRWRFWIDRGGTFTDVVALAPDGAVILKKFLSSHPERYDDAGLAAIRSCLGLPLDAALPPDRIAEVRMGTTVATNALLERRGARTALAITAGFEDLPIIGSQERPDIFARKIERPAPLFEQVTTVSARVAADGTELIPLDEQACRAAFAALRAAGIESLAICFIHAWIAPAHERRAAEIAREVGFAYVVTSHEASPGPRLVPRADTALLDAYLSPPLRRYVDQVAAALDGVRLLFMRSNGALTDAKRFYGRDAVLSGPAGGVVGAARAAAASGFERVIGFDMGGTSTDVCRYAGRYERAVLARPGGARLRAPMLDVHTVAAGGGSILRFDGTALRVGPESAGADPGPACYGRGGPATLSDANAVLGLLRADHFPALFGPRGDQPLDVAAAQDRLTALAAQMTLATGQVWSAHSAAAAFRAVAADAMADAIKTISVARGADPRDDVLCAFGGAGGQHACAVADALGMTTVLLHPLAGALSAFGIGLAAPGALREGAAERPLVEREAEALAALAARLTAEAAAEALSAAAPGATLRTTVTARLRMDGADAVLETPWPTPFSVPALVEAFRAAHRRRYGFDAPTDAVQVASLVAEAEAVEPPPRLPAPPPPRRPEDGPLTPLALVALWLADEWRNAPLHRREDLRQGDGVAGPALIVEAASCTLVDPGWRAEVDEVGALILRRAASAPTTQTPSTALDAQLAHQRVQGLVPGAGIDKGPRRPLIRVADDPKDVRVADDPKDVRVADDPKDVRVADDPKVARVAHRPDPARLRIYESLFMSIAERMGKRLENTASSVNIKERLDFSCAVFNADGALIANAPHMPVHLGSMGDSVRAADRRRGGRWAPGDAVAHNAPYDGGTHLPDVTVVSPVFPPGAPLDRPSFFVASRGHHADLGGISPGSMPPTSRSVMEEGVLFDAVPLTRDGRLLEAEIRALLVAGPYPARAPDRNLADLKAQIAANAYGAGLLIEACAAAGPGAAGLATVRAYMGHALDHAAALTHAAVAKLRDGAFAYEMDDGSVIRVAATVDAAAGRATLDFAGSSPQHPGNFNAPPAIVRAAALYVFRTLIDDPDAPLNDGCLRALEIRIPEGSMLAPQWPAAVVAGNVETSQVIVDALYGALGVQAAAQGTMNNLTFGDATHQYYETICGGAGAGPGHHGCAAIQTHMTNSRLTDPEILEMRFPVRLERFAVRRGSGGAGQWRGGDGVERSIRFLAPMSVGLLANRRRVPPFGLAGGGAGACGAAVLTRASAASETLAACFQIEAAAGDVLTVLTPGGGGYGRRGDGDGA